MAALAIVATVLAFFCDRVIDDFVRLHERSQWKALAWFMTRYADWPFLILYAGLFFLAGALWKRPRWKNLAIAMALGCFVAGVPVTVVRSLTGRTRPNSTAPQGWYGVRHDSRWLIGKAEFNSFPSGHVGAGVGFAMPLILGTRRGKIAGISFCVLLAWARVFTGYHHFSDVVAAAIAGIAGGWLVWRWVMPRLAAPRLTRTALGLEGGFREAADFFRTESQGKETRGIERLPLAGTIQLKAKRLRRRFLRKARSEPRAYPIADL